MTAKEFREAIAGGVRDGQAPLVAELQALRAALTAEPPAPCADADCVHPLEQRTDFGTTNGAPDWQCGACGYRSIGARAAVRT